MSLTADQMKAIIQQSVEEGRKQAIQEMAERRAATVTRDEAARQLKVSFPTLWRWAKSGFLTPVKVGKAVLYHQTDIDVLLNNVLPQKAM